MRIYFTEDLLPSQEEFARTWIQALRSGNYEQGKGHLASKVEDKLCYCCLGVACELSPLYEMQEGFQPYFKIEGFTATNYPSNQEKFGLANQLGNPNIQPGNTSRVWWASLPAMNDRGIPFTKIADILEADLNRELTEEKYISIVGDSYWIQIPDMEDDE